ncbi:MAG: hypothetical protein JXN60_02570 [Lentisphaerae bacterium]|nr:hypothetical protein [Lentisphaerota bacterium]
MARLIVAIPLVLGTLAAAFGGIACVALLRFSSCFRGKKALLILLAIVSVAVLSLGLVCLREALHAHRSLADVDDVLAYVIQASPEQVLEIVLIDKAHYAPLFPETHVIADTAQIALICRLLSASKAYVPNHPAGIWCCQLTLKYRETDVQCEVFSTSNNGTLVTVLAGVDISYRVGRYRNDELGAALEQIAVESADNR